MVLFWLYAGIYQTASKMAKKSTAKQAKVMQNLTALSTTPMVGLVSGQIPTGLENKQNQLNSTERNGNRKTGSVRAAVAAVVNSSGGTTQISFAYDSKQSIKISGGLAAGDQQYDSNRNQSAGLRRKASLEFKTSSTINNNDLKCSNLNRLEQHQIEKLNAEELAKKKQDSHQLSKKPSKKNKNQTSSKSSKTDNLRKKNSKQPSKGKQKFGGENSSLSDDAMDQDRSSSPIFDSDEDVNQQELQHQQQKHQSKQQKNKHKQVDKKKQKSNQAHQPHLLNTTTTTTIENSSKQGQHTVDKFAKSTTDFIKYHSQQPNALIPRSPVCSNNSEFFPTKSGSFEKDLKQQSGEQTELVTANQALIDECIKQKRDFLKKDEILFDGDQIDKLKAVCDNKEENIVEEAAKCGFIVVEQRLLPKDALEEQWNADQKIEKEQQIKSDYHHEQLFKQQQRIYMDQAYEQQFGTRRTDQSREMDARIDLNSYRDEKHPKDEKDTDQTDTTTNRTGGIVAKLSQKLKTINTSNNSLSKEAYTDQAANSSNSNQNSNQGGYNQTNLAISGSTSENYLKQQATSGSSKQRQKSKSENRARKALRTISFILG